MQNNALEFGDWVIVGARGWTGPGDPFAKAGDERVFHSVVVVTDRVVLNRQLQERIEREGDAWFSYTVLRGRTALRVNVENRRMHRDNVERLVRVIRATADRILAEPGPLMT